MIIVDVAVLTGASSSDANAGYSYGPVGLQKMAEEVRD
jgi:hypothetical protein